MSELNIDQQYELAAKIQNLVIFVGLLSVTEVDTLRKLRKQLLDQNSRLEAVAGVITPLHESEHKVSHHNAMIKRIDAIIAISESNFDMAGADKKLEDAKEGQDKIAKMFGLLG